jgi:hypothetical protein
VVRLRLYALLFVFKQIIQFSDKNTEFAMVFFDRNLLTKHQHAFPFFNSHGGTPCFGFACNRCAILQNLCLVLYKAIENEGTRQNRMLISAHGKNFVHLCESALRASLYAQKFSERIQLSMSEEEQIRELCARVANADGGSRVLTVEELRIAICNYLKSQPADESSCGKTLRMPNSATKKSTKRAA